VGPAFSLEAPLKFDPRLRRLEFGRGGIDQVVWFRGCGMVESWSVAVKEKA